MSNKNTERKYHSDIEKTDDGCLGGGGCLLYTGWIGLMIGVLFKSGTISGEIAVLVFFSMVIVGIIVFMAFSGDKMQ
ncbi:MAG: hypothetical protein U0M15_09325 [Bacillota bacterium]|nr:hypothetical protein [Bacillota bacterium]